MKKILLLGSGELGKEFVIAAQRLGQYVIACDSYAGAPAMQVADAFEVFSMLDGEALERVVNTEGQIKAFDGCTNKCIYPPYTFTVANSFFVNLYMPESSQLLMVASFGGYEEVMNAYNEAVKEGYRFGDYGDAMLIVD